MSTKKKTSYSKHWESVYSWIDSVSGNKYLAFCKLCKANIKIDNGGKSQIDRHAKSDKHLKFECEMKSQRTFFTNSGEVELPKNSSSLPLSESDLISQAEIIQAFKTVESNMSFSAANGDNDRFSTMFPDSNIAEML